jgi:hypothetical protein
VFLRGVFVTAGQRADAGDFASKLNVADPDLDPVNTAMNDNTALLMLLLQVAMIAGAYVVLYLNKQPCRTSPLGGNAYMKELLAPTSNPTRVKEVLRMPRETFIELRDWMVENNYLCDERDVLVEEQLAMFLRIVGHRDSNRDVQEHFQRSGYTVSSYFNKVLLAMLQLYRKVVLLPKGDRTPYEIARNPKFARYFHDCIGAADGTHILTKLPAAQVGRFRDRKGELSQNVLGMCTFDLQFCYVLAGWEGTAHDGRVLDYALTSGGLSVPPGKYYLVDAGYAMKSGFLPPYRGVRYHLREQAISAQAPATKEELFNLRHASLRNAVERIFGVLKKRFPILTTPCEYPMHTQARIVLAVTALHNFIRMHSDTVELDDWEGEEGLSTGPGRRRRGKDDEPESLDSDDDDDDEGMASLRDRLATEMWEDYQTQRAPRRGQAHNL